MVKRVTNISHLEQRFWEALPAGLSWTLLLVPLLLTPFLPLYVTYFVILFDLYWLFRSAKLSFYLVRTYKQLERNLRLNWSKRLAQYPQAKEIYHVILQTTYQEEIEILRASLRAIVSARYDLKKVIYVLATEERDANALQLAENLTKEFGHNFYRFITTVHPDAIPGEVAGRGSNMTWAAKELERVLIQGLGLNPDKIIISALDADAKVHPDLLSALTEQFLTAEQPHQAIYQFLPLYHNNIWEVPAAMRVVAIGCSFWMMIEMARPDRLRSFSCYAASFTALRKANYWAVESIIEDGVQYWRQYFACDGDFRTIPVRIPIYMDAVLGESYLGTYVNQYKQLKRWAWGASDLAYVTPTFLRDRRIPVWNKSVQALRLLEGHLSWATAPLLLLASGWLPLLNRSFRETVIGHNLPYLTSAILSLAMIGIGVSILISWRLQTMEKKSGRWGIKYYLVNIIQWALLPLITVIFGALPAIESQTRLALGQKMGFVCTVKKRKLAANRQPLSPLK